MVVKFHIGELKEIVTFKKNTPSTLGAGAKDSYSTLLTTRGRLRKKSGNRTLSFGSIDEHNQWELIVRFQTALETNLRMDVKIEIGGRTFTINSFEKIGEKNFYYVFNLAAQQ